MKFTFLTLFPSSYSSFLSYPVVKRALERGLVEIEVVDIKDASKGCFRAIDDSPYGGGPGLILRVDALCNALNSVKRESAKVILMGPKGRVFTQRVAHEFSKEDHIILVAGHYEGVDERFRAFIDDEISVGDFILTGGESASILVCEAVIRLLDGALRAGSAEEESFEEGILEYPQYTHPFDYEGKQVPSLLLSGNKEAIARFRSLEALKDTIRLRPDLLPTGREFKYCSVHKDYGAEAEIIKKLEGRLPLPQILYEDESYLILSRLKGRPLKEKPRKAAKTLAAVLRLLWSVEEEGKVFSHGSLSLDNVLIDGSGITGLINLQKAAFADKRHDIASAVVSLEEAGIKRSELFEALGFEIDEETLSSFI